MSPEWWSVCRGIIRTVCTENDNSNSICSKNTRRFRITLGRAKTWHPIWVYNSVVNNTMWWLINVWIKIIKTPRHHTVTMKRFKLVDLKPMKCYINLIYFNKHIWLILSFSLLTRKACKPWIYVFMHFYYY